MKAVVGEEALLGMTTLDYLYHAKSEVSERPYQKRTVLDFPLVLVP